MNRNFTKATIVGLTALAGVGSAMAQFELPPDGLPEYCWVAANPLYGSPPVIWEFDWDDLFGVVIGVNGTVTYDTGCYNPAFTQTLKGRIGFWGGRTGSVQDIAYGGSPIDDWLGITFGSYFGVAGNKGYAKTIRNDGTNDTRTLFGQNIDTAYYGASDRYWVVEGTNDNIRIHLRGDVMGDTARLEWTLTNQGASASIGLDFGNTIDFFSPYIGAFVPCSFIEVPGYRPLLTDHRFARQPNLASIPRQNAMPPYANFGITQSLAYGIQVPTMANSSIPDQTPVDILDIGKSGFLLGLQTADDTPMPPYTANGVILEDTSITQAAFVQRWLPQTVNQNDSRVITAYYKTTWGVSDYAKPYSAVVDAPKVVAVQNNDPNVFNPNPMTIRVFVDNTRGFASVEKPIPLNDVRITLNLPQGMTDANNPTSNRIVRTIDVVPPVTAKNPLDPFLDKEHHDLNYADFPVRVDPTLYGLQSYTVTIAPNPGPVKTLVGSINVASQPKLLIRDSANLVTAPWNFTDGSWATILGTGSDPLVINRDFQTFEWDAAQQAYVIQTSPKRGFGNWIISTRDVGFTTLGGNPRTPPDLANGAPLIVLKPGWNLIANPYNYSIPISQIVGVTATDPTESQTFADLANQNIIGSTLSYWDQNTQSYKFTGSFTDLLIPNRGYWLYVNSSQDVTLSFGPVYQAFIPPGTGGIEKAKRVAQRTITRPSAFSTPHKWWVNLTVRTNKVLDKENFIGVAKNVADVPGSLVAKPPVAPVGSAVSAAVVQSNGQRNLLLAQSLRPDATSNTWNWQVFTRSAGSATIAWPNVDKVPTTVNLTLVDIAANKSMNMRQVSSYTFNGQANSAHQFRIVASTTPVYTGPVITSLTAERSGIGRTAPFTIKYQLGTTASTTIRVLNSSGQEMRIVAQNRQDAAGSNTASWDLHDAAGRTVKAGVYTIQVTSTATGRNPEVKTTTVFVY